MSDNSLYTPIQEAWVNFVKSVQLILILREDDRPLDQFLEFRDAVIPLVLDQRFLDDLDSSLDKFASGRLQFANALILELKAFPRSVDVAKSTDGVDGKSSGWLGKLLGRASTITGSVQDAAESNPYAKGAIGFFKEAIDIFRGDGGN